MGREKPVDDGAVRGASGVVAVTVIGIQDLVLGADPVEQRMAGLRWAYIVLQSDVHDDRAGDPVGEVDPVEVGDGFLDFRSALGVAPHVVVDLLVGIRVRQLDGIEEAAEVRGARGRRAHLRAHGGRRDRQPATLAASGDADTLRIHLGPPQQEIDAAPGVDVEATVRVGVPVDDVVRQ